MYRNLTINSSQFGEVHLLVNDEVVNHPILLNLIFLDILFQIGILKLSKLNDFFYIGIIADKKT